MNDFQTFWYVLATGLAGVLVVIIGRYISKTEKVLEKLSDNVSELKSTAAVADDNPAKMKNGCWPHPFPVKPSGITSPRN